MLNDEGSSSPRGPVYQNMFSLKLTKPTPHPCLVHASYTCCMKISITGSHCGFLIRIGFYLCCIDIMNSIRDYTFVNDVVGTARTTWFATWRSRDCGTHCSVVCSSKLGDFHREKCNKILNN